MKNSDAPFPGYGPPGTRQVVDAIISSEKPLRDLDTAGNPQAAQLAPSEVAVVEIVDGQQFSVDDVKITAAENSHYSFQPGTANYKAYQSLSLRFDMSDRSIIFTGDTGPSDAVQAPAKGANLLVSESTDPAKHYAGPVAFATDLDKF